MPCSLIVKLKSVWAMLPYKRRGSCYPDISHKHFGPTRRYTGNGINRAKLNIVNKIKIYNLCVLLATVFCLIALTEAQPFRGRKGNMDYVSFFVINKLIKKQNFCVFYHIIVTRRDFIGYLFIIFFTWTFQTRCNIRGIEGSHVEVITIRSNFVIIMRENHEGKSIYFIAPYKPVSVFI